MARVAFCQDVMVEYMGFMCMSAVLKQAGHDVEIFIDDSASAERFNDELKAFRPDVVAFSILSPSMPWAVQVAQRIKADLDVVTVFGNVHVMLAPEESIAKPGVDIICTGEGEHALLELCNALDAGEDYTSIRGFWIKQPGGEIIRNPMREEMVDMDAMPYIDRAMYNKHFFFRHSRYVRILTGRGCPFRCSFCSNPVLTDHYGGPKRYFRKRSPQTAVDEIKDVISKQPGKVDMVFFVDEVLWIKNDWLREFLPLYKEQIGLPFFGNFRFGAIQEADVKLLAECGAYMMAVAIESGSEEQRKGVMNKPVSNAHILEVTGWMRKYGINYASSAFFGMPGDTVQDHVDRLAFYRQAKPFYLWTTFFQPYPGLRLTAQEDVQSHLPQDREFKATLHHDMYLDLPDRQRLVNLKKVYFYMMVFPALEKPLLWLTQFKLPLVFDVIFLTHFIYYALRVEHVSLLQFLFHVKTMCLNPLLRKRQTLQHIGRPYTPPDAKEPAKERERSEAA
ncbi:MAG: radical SAM protein [Candidatus Hydrogenedens sp.]|nr:radical SAM protein [Candidatus Hydrogenedens sp.]